MQLELNWNLTKSEIEFDYDEYLRKPDKYLFSKQVRELLRFCDGIVSESAEIKHNTNNIISVIGDRGTGKSSFLRTSKKILEKEGYFVFQVIDPSIFDDSLSLLEFFISHMYLYLTGETYEVTQSVDDSIDESLHKQKSELVAELKILTRTLSNMKIDKGSFASNSASGEILMDLSSRVRFGVSFSKLVQKFFDYICTARHFKGLVLCVDDLDMVENDMTFVMLEDIQKYLSKNLILIISFRENQLINSIMQKKISDNERLLNNSIIGLAEIENQTRSYFEKISPRTRSILLNNTFEISKLRLLDVVRSVFYLFDEGEIENQFIHGNNLNDKEINVVDWISAVIFKKTGLKISPVDEKERLITSLPSNLRETLQIIEIVQTRMNVIQTPEKIGLDYLTMFHNTKVLEELYIPLVKNKLPLEYKSFIDNWEKSENSKKNYSIYEHLVRIILSKVGKNQEQRSDIDYFFLSREDIARLIKINDTQTYNISLGDVYFALEIFKKFNSSSNSECLVVYFIKLEYSIYLLKNYLGFYCFSNGLLKNVKVELENESTYFRDYNLLTKGKIMSDDFSIIQTILTYRKRGLIDHEFLSVHRNYDSVPTSNRKSSIVDEDYIDEIYQKLFSSDSTVAGNISRFGKKYIGKFDSRIEAKQKNDTLLFSYRPQYQTFDEFGALDSNQKYSRFIEGRKYIVDFFSYLVNASYLYETIQSVDKFVFYSLFDLDVLVRINFGRQTEDLPINYAIKKFNNLLQNKLSIDFDINISKSLFDNMGTTHNDFEPIFNDIDIQFIEILENKENEETKKTGAPSNQSEYIMNIRDKYKIIQIVEWVINSQKLKITEINELKETIETLGVKGKKLSTTIKKDFLAILISNAIVIPDSIKNNG